MVRSYEKAMESGRRARYSKDPAVRGWYKRLELGSPATADALLQRLGRFLEETNLTAQAFLQMEPRARAELVEDHLLKLHEAGKAPSTVRGTKVAILGFLDSKDAEVPTSLRRWKINSNGNDAPTLEHSHIPDQDELRRVLAVADPRTRVAISFTAFAGQRPEVLGDWRGTNGLRVGDLAEIRRTREGEPVIEDGTIIFERVPTLVKVPPKLGGHRYVSFLGPEGCEYLSDYIRQRISKGEEIMADSPILARDAAHRDCNCHPRGGFVTRHNISLMVRAAMRTAGVKLRPYSWRGFFSNRCQLVEAKGLLRDYKEYMMGHVNSISRTYSAGHGELPPDTLEEMRRGCGAALPHLETRPMGPRQDPTTKTLALLLKALNFGEEEVEQMDLEHASEEKIIAAIRGAVAKVREGGTRHQANGGARQRVVSIGELEGLLSEGWSFKASLADGRVVLERN